jgi:hypothetical protein
MKRTFVACLTGILVSLAMTSRGYSQNLSALEKPETFSENRIGFPVVANAATNTDMVAPGEVSPKAVKHFSRDYKRVTDVNWFKANDGFVAYFTVDGIKTRAFYDRKGHDAGTIRDYSEDKLPRDVRHLVRSTYYDFNITYVYEVTYDGVTAYLVHMQDQTHWKTVKVIDGEMAVIDEYLKR